ncbi:MAG: winged helix-turn-helix domain-containing protein [Candidatus Omnitrophota bacterium]
MITKIGLVAGDIWQYLDKKPEGVSFKELCREIDEPCDYILMSLGWLAREGHVVMQEAKAPLGGSRDYKVILRKKE